MRSLCHKRRRVDCRWIAGGVIDAKLRALPERLAGGSPVGVGKVGQGTAKVMMAIA